MDERKVCRDCRKWLPIERFGVRRNSKDGRRRDRCGVCLDVWILEGAKKE